MQRGFYSLIVSLLFALPSAFAQSGPGSLQMTTRQDLPAFQVRQAMVVGLALRHLVIDLQNEIQILINNNETCHFNTITCDDAHTLLMEMNGPLLSIALEPKVVNESDAARIRRQRNMFFNDLAYSQWRFAKEIPQFGGMGRALNGLSPDAEYLCQDIFTLYWMLHRSFVSDFPTFSGYTVYDDSVKQGTIYVPRSVVSQMRPDFENRLPRALELAKVMKFYASELATRLNSADATGTCLLPMPCSPTPSQKMNTLVLRLGKFDQINNASPTLADLAFIKDTAYGDAASAASSLYRDVFLKVSDGRVTSQASSREAAEGLFQSYFMLSCHFYECPRAVGGSSGGGRDD